MKRKVLSIIILYLICSSLDIYAQLEEDFRPVETITIEGIIVPKRLGKHFFWRSGYQPERYWTPEESEILQAEKKLAVYLREKSLTLPPNIWRNLHEYYRQYVGAVINGKKIIWFNFFHKKTGDESWKREPVIVMGGGSRYFNIMYDVESEQFFNLQINAVR